MLPKPPLHAPLHRLRAELRAGTVPDNTPAHLLRSAQAWEELDRAAHDPDPGSDPVRLCARVVDCAYALIQARPQIGSVLATLADAADADLERIDRALSAFDGLDSPDLVNACFLALSTEAERAWKSGALMPRVIACKIADAMAANVQGEAHGKIDRPWMRFVFSRTPVAEAVRIARLLRENPADLLESPRAMEDPEILFCAAPTVESARAIVATRDGKALRNWVDALPDDGTKDKVRAVLVPALAEEDRVEEALFFWEEIRSEQLRSIAAEEALEACAARLREADALGFLSRLPQGKAVLRGRLLLLRHRLHASGDSQSAIAEMNAIEQEISAACGGNLRDWRMLASGASGHLISFSTVRYLSEAWLAVVLQQRRDRQFFEALKTAERMHDLMLRAGIVWRVLAAAQRMVSAEDALSMAQKVVRMGEESDCREHALRMLDYATAFLAREGSRGALNAALKLVAEKLAAADASARDNRTEAILVLFVQCPPHELSFKETAAVMERIHKPASRASCLRALALHAALDGDWDESGRLMHRAEEVPQPQNEATPEAGSSTAEPKPGIPEFLNWMRNKEKAVGGEADTHFWFSEAFALAQSLHELQEQALYAVGRLLIESPHFAGQQDLYARLLLKLQDPHRPDSGLFYVRELRRLLATARWSPSLESLREIQSTAELNPPSYEEASPIDPSPPHPRLIQKHFRALLNRLEPDNDPDHSHFFTMFLRKSAEHVLHPIHEPVVDALFEAARQISNTPSQGAFAARLHGLARKPGDTPAARRVAAAARTFAEQTGALPEYESHLPGELPPEAGGHAGEPEISLEKRIRNLDFETAFSLVAAEEAAMTRLGCATELFEKALALGDRHFFSRVFDLAEAAFIAACTQHGTELPVEFSTPWFGLLGRLPHVADRVQLLGRMETWFRLLGFHDREEMLSAWVAQMVAAGQVDRALRAVETLKSADKRAHGFMEIALARGLTRGDVLAEEMFEKFLEAFHHTIAVEPYPLGACLALKRAAEGFVETGNPEGLRKILDEGKKLFRGKCGPFSARRLLEDTLVTLAGAGRTDLWAEVLESCLQSGQMQNWTWSEFSYLLEHMWKHRSLLPRRLTQAQRVVFLEKVFAMAERAGVSMKTKEALLLHICLHGAEDPRRLIHRFADLSDCSPEVVEGLLGRNLLYANPSEDTPPPPDPALLCWIASLCPYSGKTARLFFEHLAGRNLEANNWSTLQKLAAECSALNTDWLEKLALAVLSRA